MKYLIVTAESTSGRYARGLSLWRFLSIYHGRGAVRMMSRRQLARQENIEIDVLLIGLPTSLAPADLAGVRFRQAVLFDYSDRAGPKWENSNEAFLRSIASHCLKPCVEADWQSRFQLRFGALPIRRPLALTLLLWLRKFVTGDVARASVKSIDVNFLGNATAYQRQYPQRLQWLHEIADSPHGLTFWGGLVLRKQELQLFAQQYPDGRRLVLPRSRINFLEYFWRLSKSRIALTPAGNARWSYRQYEAIYAGALPVTTDMRSVEMLIPLPRDGMIHVPDHEPVLPHIRAGLAILRNRPQVLRENIAFLEQYLSHGDYSRTRPRLLERFESQLAGAARQRSAA